MRRHPRRQRSADAELVRRAARRFGLQAAAGTALVIAVLVAVTLGVLVGDQNVASDTLLADAVARADDVQDPPSGTWLVIRTPDRTQQTNDLPPGLPIGTALDRVAAGGPTELASVSVGGRTFRVRTELRDIPGSGPAAVQGVLDLSREQAQLASVLRALLIGGLVALALAALAGHWLGRRAVRPLHAALGLQRRFVADAAHELRTPLTLLSTRAQLLRRGLAGRASAERVRVEVDGVVDDAQRLAAILDDLLLAAEPSSGVVQDVVDLASLADDVVAATRPTASVQVVVSRAPSTGAARVLGSPAGLHRALTALVDNALRHAASEVVVTVTDTGRSVVVQITDDGPGIDADVLPRLFERFASGHDGPEGGTRRYGLGLALVSDIVDRHRGTVTAATRPGGGAVLRVELPTAAT